MELNMRFRIHIPATQRARAHFTAAGGLSKYLVRARYFVLILVRAPDGLIVYKPADLKKSG